MALVLPILEIAGVAAKRTGPRVRASGRVKYRETRIVRVSDPLRGLGILPLFTASLLRVSSPPYPALREQQQNEGGGDKGDYYVNMGYAIRTLREELPEMFYREPCFDIYRDDIVFKDPLNAFGGINNYKLILWALRLSGRLCFKAIWVDIVSIWQPMENIIMIRWIAHGIPRVPWESRGRFDGTSEYKLDKKGKIFEHRVDNVALNSPPKFKVLAVEEMIQSLGCPSTPKPTFFKLLFSRTHYMLVMLRFTWFLYRVCVSLREMKQQRQQENPTSMSFDDVSMERNKNFVNALQELKSLRPQLYSAAEYCEKSYLHNEQKQIVLDNLKDYAVRALVNTVDHLGTVANKLTDLFEQQRVDVLSFELNVSYLKQRILTCQIYTDSEGLKKQQMLATTTRHHKHYILPNSASRKVWSSGNLPTGVAQNEAPNLITSVGDLNTYNNSISVHCHLPVREKAAAPWPFLDHLKSATSTGSNLVRQKFDVMDPLGASKRSFDNSRSREFQRRPQQSKSMLVSILAKTKSSKWKKLKSPEVR